MMPNSVDTSDSTERPHAARHALVIDDVPELRRSMAFVLTAAGFIPHELDQPSGVEAALACNPALVVLDLSLATEGGADIMGTLAAAGFAGKVLLVSGHDATRLAEANGEGERRGLTMLPAMRKPIRLAELRARLALLENPSQSDARHLRANR